MTTREIISAYLTEVENQLRESAAATNNKMPRLRQEVTDTEGKLYGPHYFQYLVYGRGPGKQPPPDAMLSFVQRNPQMLADAQAIWKNITERGLAYLIGRKIGREGTDIYSGKKQGIDLQGSIEKPRAEFLQRLAYQSAMAVASGIKRAAQKV